MIDGASDGDGDGASRRDRFGVCEGPEAMNLAGHVFGYGSLAAEGLVGVDRTRRRDGFVADLPGFARVWGVAMDNSHALPGYKRYRDPSGAVPAVYVTFLDVRRARGGSVNGVCLPVDSAALARLDDRERNYERIDVSAAFGGELPVWTYVGSAAGRARLHEGMARGTAVIDAGYLATVRRGFAALGAAELARCEPSLDPGGLPVVALTREELPAPEDPRPGPGGRATAQGASRTTDEPRVSRRPG